MRKGTLRVMLGTVACGALLGCQSTPFGERLWPFGSTPATGSADVEPVAPPAEPDYDQMIYVGELIQAIDPEVYRRAYAERDARLEREIERLQTDLLRAESALIEADSDARGEESRADAVSSLAEVWVLVERVAGAVPWAAQQSDDARAKLEEAGRQIDAGHFSAGLYLVERGRTIAQRLQNDADELRGPEGPLFVRPARANLRSGPSTEATVLTVLTAGTPAFVEAEEAGWALVRTFAGSVGWVHRSLIGERGAAPAAPEGY